MVAPDMSVSSSGPIRYSFATKSFVPDMSEACGESGAFGRKLEEGFAAQTAAPVPCEVAVPPCDMVPLGVKMELVSKASVVKSSFHFPSKCENQSGKPGVSKSLGNAYTSR